MGIIIDYCFRVRHCRQGFVWQDFSAHYACCYRLSEAPAETTGGWEVHNVFVIRNVSNETFQILQCIFIRLIITVSSPISSCGTVCDSNFWLELNYLEVAKAAQSSLAHFTALLYTEIYIDKIKSNMEESRRYAVIMTLFFSWCCMLSFIEFTCFWSVHLLDLQNKVSSNTQDQFWRQ